jgi:hypothetical protein
MNWLLNTLWWFSGTDSDTIKTCSARDKALRTALGLVFLLNYVALLLAWIKVGMRYFGWAGFIPGLIVPSIFLALDRIIAMRHRHLSGILAVYNIGQADDKAEVKLRVAMALALSLATTFTFQLDQANSLIRDKTQMKWKAANSALRQEITAQVEAEYTQKLASVEQRQKSLAEQRAITSDSLVDATNAAKESTAKARAARDQQSYEKGGLDGRPAGEATKFHAQRELAERNEGIAAEAQSHQQAATKALEALDGQLSKVALDRLNAEKDKTTRLAQVDELMRQDSRFVHEKVGLFSDATIFVGLFFDPDVAAGMWVMSLLMWGVLLALELSALIALAILPASAYDIALVANLRVEAARLVAAAEIKLAQQPSQSPPIHVRPRPGYQRPNQGNPINEGANREQK